MIARRLTIRSVVAALLVTVLAGALRPVLAEDEDPQRLADVEGVVYEVFHGDSVHRMGFYVREIHVPSRAFAFTIEGGELRVFRPKAHRYLLPGQTFEIELPNGEKHSLPFLAIPGTETRRVGSVRLRAEHVDRLQTLLSLKTRLRAIAEQYFEPRSEYEPVVAYLGLNPTAGAFIVKLLDEAGIRCVGISNAGGETLSVPKEHAEEARRILYEALVKGLSNPPPAPASNPGWDGHLDYQVMDSAGYVIWSLDRTLVPPTPPRADVLAHLKRFPGTETVDVDGQARRPEYGDLRLEEAESTLRGKLPRPWTVDALIEAYRKASDPESKSDLEGDVARAALLYLLAASRSPQALPLVGEGLSDESLEVRVAATEGINTYWNPELLSIGGLEGAMMHARAWWDAFAR
jgi:hypothetical protein